MARIQPLTSSNISLVTQEAFNKHVTDYNARITNMKATLAHSLLAFEVYMQWYPLYREVEKITGKRLAYLYAYSISHASNCPLCSTFFRKIIIDGGEKPEDLKLSSAENNLVEFGIAIAKENGNINDQVYQPVSLAYSKEKLIILIAFAGQMIATNVFNNVIETDIDDYLTSYLPT